MENISYIEHVIWGTSLDMATEEEVDYCYTHIKKHIKNGLDNFHLCKFSEEKNGVSPSSVMLYDNPFQHYTKDAWGCGRECKKGDLCDKMCSIKADDLVKVIESMVNNDINIDGKKVIKAFNDKKYILIYSCDRVFFIK